MEEQNLLEHAVISQIKKDLNENDLESLSELISNLIHLEPANKLLVEYLSDDLKERWLEGKVELQY